MWEAEAGPEQGQGPGPGRELGWMCEEQNERGHELEAEGPEPVYIALLPALPVLEALEALEALPVLHT